MKYFQRVKERLTNKLIMTKQETSGKFYHNDLAVFLELEFLFNKPVCQTRLRNKFKQKVKEIKLVDQLSNQSFNWR